MEKVSKTVQVQKLTAHQNFCDDVFINTQIKQGGWVNLHTEGMIVNDLRDAIQLEYDLDDATIDCIKVIYSAKVGENGNKKSVRIFEGGERLEGTIRTEDNPAHPGWPLTLNNLTIKVRHQRGDMVEKDIN